MAVRGTAGTPERLRRVEGTWRLELERLVYSSPWMLRPFRFEVQGEPAILQQLRQLKGCENLARDAERLFAATPADGAFLAREGRWNIELTLEPVAYKPERTAPASAVQAEELARMAERIDGLEASVRALQKMLQDVAKTAIRAVTLAESPNRAAATAATQYGAAPNTSPKHAPIEDELGLDEAEASEDVEQHAPVEPEAPAERAPIALPSAAGITDLVRSLAGADAALVPRAGIDWERAQHVFVGLFQTNDLDEVGALVFDLEAALRLAGALLMEADETIAAQIEEGLMSEEMLDAASEVCNTFMSAFNKISGNPHVKAEKLRALDQTLADRIGRARKRDDYGYNRGGNLSLLAF